MWITQEKRIESVMVRFFTADTHFGHQGIIEYDNRPFQTVDEMDDGLVARWNEVVSKSDIVYHLGDFSWRGSALAGAILDRLNGQIHLVLGNHDKLNGATLSRFASVSQIKVVRVEGIKIFLCHYPLRAWVGQSRGAWNLHGHSHGRLYNPYSFTADVGVNCWDYHPVSFGELRVKFQNDEIAQKEDLSMRLL